MYLKRHVKSGFAGKIPAPHLNLSVSVRAGAVRFCFPADFEEGCGDSPVNLRSAKSASRVNGGGCSCIWHPPVALRGSKISHFEKRAV